MVRNGAFAITVVALIAVSGCGDARRASMSGSVTLNGQPVNGGTISIIPEAATDSIAVWGDINNGHYSLSGGSGLTVGTNRVEIRWPKTTGRKVALPPPARQGSLIEETVEVIPMRYNIQSELHVDIKQGENKLDFRLDSR
jgi:hypothetical protein